MTHQEKLEELKKLIGKDKITSYDIHQKCCEDPTRSMSYESKFDNGLPLGQTRLTVTQYEPNHIKPGKTSTFIWEFGSQDDLTLQSPECIDILYEYLLTQNIVKSLE